jgi:hypothetical protein
VVGDDAGLELYLRANKTSYVTKEPVKFEVTIKNRSDTTKRILVISDWDMQMYYIFFEVVTPSRAKQLRIYQRFMDSRVIFGEGWAGPPGEPLAPMDSLRTFLYPTATKCSNYPRVSQGFCSRWTFGDTGTYRVRVCYFVPKSFETVWVPPNGELKSNEVVLTIRDPDEAEREILAAYWAEDKWEPCDEMYPPWHHDRGLLAEMIKKYPTHPFVNYLRLAFARGCYDLENPAYADGISVLEELRLQHPEFRRAEVMLMMAILHFKAGDREQAMGVLAESFQGDPELVNNYNFMKWAIRIESGDKREIAIWERDRREGVDRYGARFTNSH